MSLKISSENPTSFHEIERGMMFFLALSLTTGGLYDPASSH